MTGEDLIQPAVWRARGVSHQPGAGDDSSINTHLLTIRLSMSLVDYCRPRSCRSRGVWSDRNARAKKVNAGQRNKGLLSHHSVTTPTTIVHCVTRAGAGA